MPSSSSFASRELTPRERHAFGGALSVIQLFEATVVLAGPQRLPFRPPLRREDGEVAVEGVDYVYPEPDPGDFARLLRDAERLVGGLPPEELETMVLNSVCAPRHYTPLAWAIAHLGDSIYHKARVRAGMIVELAERAHELHPVDPFTATLEGYVQLMLRKGREAAYRAHGWLREQRVDLDPGEYVAGNLRRFDALGNAIVMADARRITGYEAWLQLGSPDPDDPSEDDNTNSDEGDALEAPPPKYQLEIRTFEALAWLSDNRPVLPKNTTVTDLYEKYKAQGVTRKAIENAFDNEVPPDRRRGRGRPVKNNQ
jgi:hypothetical protein